MNFGLAIERARQEGLKVDSITIGEDCALTSSDRSAGRRGLAGTVLLNKVKSILTCRTFDVNVYVALNI